MTEQPTNKLVTVFYSQGPLPAEVAKSKLAANGIASILRYQSVGRVIAVTVNGLGLVEVLVAAADAERARQLLADTVDDSEFETSSEGD